MENVSENDYQVRLCRIIDAEHHEAMGTDDDPEYKQGINLLLQDIESGMTFIAPLSETDLIDLSELDFNLNSKEMIRLAEWFRNYDSFAEKNNMDPHVRLLVPKSGNKIDKETLLNTPVSSTTSVSYRNANIKRFQFNKQKIKKG
jgi:uncharacterized protein YukJ